jgi:hypothetical protein
VSFFLLILLNLLNKFNKINRKNDTLNRLASESYLQSTLGQIGGLWSVTATLRSGERNSGERKRGERNRGERQAGSVKRGASSRKRKAGSARVKLGA